MRGTQPVLAGVFRSAGGCAPPAIVEAMLSEANATWQMKHCIEEFHYLAGFLPKLYAAEGGGAADV